MISLIKINPWFSVVLPCQRTMYTTSAPLGWPHRAQRRAVACLSRLHTSITSRDAGPLPHAQKISLCLYVSLFSLIRRSCLAVPARSRPAAAGSGASRSTRDSCPCSPYEPAHTLSQAVTCTAHASRRSPAAPSASPSPRW